MCKRVYLDTAHWIDLAEGNGPVVGFEEAVSDGIVVPVSSYTHLLELARQQEDGRRTVSQYIDRVRSMGKTLWAHPRHTLEQAEVTAAFARSCGVKPPGIQPFEDSLVETLPDDPKEPITEELKSEPVESHVEKVHIGCMAYCDVGFADARTCEALKQGKSPILPKRNREFEEWLATL